jgi:uncharacterized protein YggU (UPF0235/DUF167 family)
VRVRVRLTPGATAERIDGLLLEADGSAALKIAVTAVPEDGKANAALIALLAKEWKRPKTSISVVAGAASRRKTLLLAGDSAAMLRSLESWLTRLAASR